jgi:hypothetical protein
VKKCHCGNPNSCYNHTYPYDCVAWTKIGDKGSIHIDWDKAGRCEKFKQRTADISKKMNGIVINSHKE